MGRSPRATLDNAFNSPRKAESRNPDSSPGSPQSTHRRSSLWLSIKGRANRSASIGKEVAQAEEHATTCPRSPIDDSAPFLVVDIPDGTLRVSQLLLRSKSRSGTGSPFSIVRDSMNFYKAKDESTETASGKCCLGLRSWSCDRITYDSARVAFRKRDKRSGRPASCTLFRAYSTSHRGKDCSAGSWAQSASNYVSVIYFAYHQPENRTQRSGGGQPRVS